MADYDEVHPAVLRFFKDIIEEFNRIAPRDKFITTHFSAIVPHLKKISTRFPERIEPFRINPEFKRRAKDLRFECGEVITNGTRKLTEYEVEYIAEDFTRLWELEELLEG